MPKYKGILVYQRPSDDALPLFVLVAPAREVLTWARILRTAEVEGAAQRLESPGHIKSIRSYVSASPVNIIPTSITLAIGKEHFSLPKNKRPEKLPGSVQTELTIADPSSDDDEGKPGYVIDGQHRLKALSATDGDIPVVVTVILGASQLERVLNFVVINNKAKRIASDLVRGIVAELGDADKESLGTRLEKVGLTLGDYPTALKVLGANEDSPFCKLVDWDINRDGKRRVKPQALENALRVILSMLRAPDRLDIDDAVAILAAMWRGIAEAWDDTGTKWSDEKSKLPDKAGLVAVTEFLVERLNVKLEEGFDAGDPAEVQAFCKGVMATVKPAFWLLPWNKKELDTSTGRSIIKQSLAALRTAVSSSRDDPLAAVPLLRAAEGD